MVERFFISRPHGLYWFRQVCFKVRTFHHVSGSQTKGLIIRKCVPSLDKVSHQRVDHIPEKLVLIKLVFDSDPEFFHFCFNHTRKLTSLYQKFNIMAIHKIFWDSLFPEN